MASQIDERSLTYRRAAEDRGLVYNGFHVPYYKPLRMKARELRDRLTTEERRVYGFLKAKGIGFRCQHPIDYYIVDFYLPDSQLIIEIDGSQHHTEQGLEYDAVRDEILQLYKLEILRISNAELRNYPPTPFSKILNAIAANAKRP